MFDKKKGEDVIKEVRKLFEKYGISGIIHIPKVASVTLAVNDDARVLLISRAKTEERYLKMKDDLMIERWMKLDNEDNNEKGDLNYVG